MGVEITLMVDWETWPLWVSADEDIPDSYSVSEIAEIVPLSSELLEKISNWNAEFQDKYNKSSPQDSGFASEQELQVFLDEGRILAQCLRSECPPEITILYGGDGSVNELIELDDTARADSSYRTRSQETPPRAE